MVWRATSSMSKVIAESGPNISRWYRAASVPTASIRSLKVTNSPERFDIFTGTPARRNDTNW